MDKYKQLLNSFVGDDEMRELLLKPARMGERTVASDGYSLVSVPVSYEEYEDKTDKFAPVFPEKTMDKVFDINIVRQVLDKMPKHKALLTDVCSYCYGEGEAEHSFIHEGKYYTAEFECPVCDGEGGIETGYSEEEVYEEDKHIRLGAGLFNPNILERLVYVSDTLKIAEIHLLAGYEHKPYLFSIGEVELILMPVTSGEAYSIIDI